MRARQLMYVMMHKRRPMLFILLLCFVATLYGPTFRLTLALSQFTAAVESCTSFMSPLETVEDTADSFPYPVLDMLLSVDHIFVLSLHSCHIKLPKSFKDRATCIIGQTLDSCAPRPFIRGPYAHALKVSFAHATVLHVAYFSKYKKIAVIEDDVYIRPRSYSKNLSNEFRSVLHSNAWSIIRFGFRPYFLEENSRAHCPRKCQCEIRTQISQELCEMPRSGCDMRSSDFYVIHADFYLPLRNELLDLSNADSKRIVDTRPMRKFRHQWLMLPQLSIQSHLDIPVDYQVGLSALYVKKCVHPRPLPRIMTQQLLNISHCVNLLVD